MEEIIKLTEEAINKAQWEIDYHLNQVELAKTRKETLEKELRKLNDFVAPFEVGELPY